jgi:hypothetical protein
MYGLDDTATEMQKAIVADGLLATFPAVEFQFVSEPGPFLENNIIPLVGRPHPTEPDCAIIEMVPDALRERVRETFVGLIATAGAAVPS